MSSTTSGPTPRIADSACTGVGCDRTRLVARSSGARSVVRSRRSAESARSVVSARRSAANSQPASGPRPVAADPATRLRPGVSCGPPAHGHTPLRSARPHAGPRGRAWTG